MDEKVIEVDFGKSKIPTFAEFTLVQLIETCEMLLDDYESVYSMNQQILELLWKVKHYPKETDGILEEIQSLIEGHEWLDTEWTKAD